MNRFASTTALFVAIAGFSMHAQTLNLRASIPFNFRMGKVLMPAGDYQIYHSNGVVRVRGESGRVTGALSLSRATSRPGKATLGALEFNRYDDNYFLTKVWAPYSNDGQVLPTSKEEKMLVSRGALVETASVAIRKE